MDLVANMYLKFRNYTYSKLLITLFKLFHSFSNSCPRLEGPTTSTENNKTKEKENLHFLVFERYQSVQDNKLTNVVSQLK